jgi:hypothetical protein
MPRSKVSALVSALLVFVSGAAVGAAGYRLYAVKAAPTATSASTTKKSPDEIRKLLISSLKDKVKLDANQVAEVQKIYQEQREAFDQINAKYHARVDPILDPVAKQFNAERDQLRETSNGKIRTILHADQIPLYEQWQADRAADRKRHEQQQQRDHPGPRPPLPPLPPLP